MNDKYINRQNVKTRISVLAAILLMVLPLLGEAGKSFSSASRRPDLEFLKAVNQAAPPQDPQLLFLLMGQYSSANRQLEGVQFFSQRLEEFNPRLTDVLKAL